MTPWPEPFSGVGSQCLDVRLNYREEIQWVLCKMTRSKMNKLMLIHLVIQPPPIRWYLHLRASRFCTSCRYLQWLWEDQTPRTLLSQLWHSPEKEQTPARKHRGIWQGLSAAASAAPTPLVVPPQWAQKCLLEDIPTTLHRFSLRLDASGIIVSTLRWQQTSKPASSIYQDAWDR